VFDSNLTFDKTRDTLCGAAGRALGMVVNKMKYINNMGFQSYTKLYENCVCPVMDYCSGIWGIRKFQIAENVHNRAMRFFLGVHRFTPIAAMTGDMG